MWETTTKGGHIVPIQISSTLIVVRWSHNGESEPLDAKQGELFRTIVLNLMYLATNTRPGQHDMQAAKRVKIFERNVGFWIIRFEIKTTIYYIC